MKKPFLLIENETYYPGSGTQDWIGCYETYEEAQAAVKDKYFNGEIVDLRDWCE